VPLGRALARIEPHIPILVAKCALSRPADDVETHTPRHWKDAASRKIHLVAIESRSCFSLWKVNQNVNLDIEMVWTAEDALVMEAITIFGIEPVDDDLDPDEERVRDHIGEGLRNLKGPVFSPGPFGIFPE
jgi:hypothetical protein